MTSAALQGSGQNLCPDTMTPFTLSAPSEEGKKKHSSYIYSLSFLSDMQMVEGWKDSCEDFVLFFYGEGGSSLGCWMESDAKVMDGVK